MRKIWRNKGVCLYALSIQIKQNATKGWLFWYKQKLEISLKHIEIMDFEKATLIASVEQLIETVDVKKS